jgi:UDP-3-O-[3-hydroxymyristoyl] N-acetylglucosamine deacetylase/3-hydroxyacyl-[acyl-carrier-protein] dehydratase
MLKMQQTIERDISYSGVGLHTGNSTTMTFKPAGPNTGIIFKRIDLPDKPEIPADIEHVIDISRGTTLGINGAKVHTVEHVLAAITGLEIDNIIDINIAGTVDIALFDGIGSRSTTEDVVNQIYYIINVYST